MQRRFNIAQFLLGLFVLIPGGVLIACLWAPLGAIVMLGGIALTIAAFYNRDFFCEDCGQYLGMGLRYPPSLCERCGCNIFTDIYDGVGPTYRTQRRRRDRRDF